MKIAVLVTCHNRRETTLRCFRSLCRPVDVYLVDDGSTDGTSEAAVELFKLDCFSKSKLYLTKASGSLYWAKGMALAWHKVLENKCRYDFVLWLNDDVVLNPGAIESMLSDWRLCQSEKVVIVGACSDDNTGMKSSYGATDSKDVRIPPNGIPQKADGWFNGNVVLVPRATYETIGLISGDYSHGRADYDYAERLKRAGIPFFCSSQYVGICHRDKAEKIALAGRWGKIASLWKPGYLNLHDLWIFKLRYHGFWRAVISCLHAIIIAFK